MRSARIQFRRGSSSLWESENPILHDGEPGYERNTGRVKIGDGSTPWNDLPYQNESGTSALDLIEAHLEDETPHPVYDDGPSLALLYANAKV